MNYFILLPIVAAFLLGASIPFQNFDSDEKINKYATISTFLVSIITFIVLFSLNGERVTLFSFNSALNVTFKIDGLSTVFASMVSFLWPLAVIYATEYMKHEGLLRKFYTFYIGNIRQLHWVLRFHGICLRCISAMNF